MDAKSKRLKKIIDMEIAKTHMDIIAVLFVAAMIEAANLEADDECIRRGLFDAKDIIEGGGDK